MLSFTCAECNDLDQILFLLSEYCINAGAASQNALTLRQTWTSCVRSASLIDNIVLIIAYCSYAANDELQILCVDRISRNRMSTNLIQSRYIAGGGGGHWFDFPCRIFRWDHEIYWIKQSNKHLRWNVRVMCGPLSVFIIGRPSSFKNIQKHIELFFFSSLLFGAQVCHCNIRSQFILFTTSSIRIRCLAVLEKYC